MQTAVIKRSIVLDGHKTSVSLENEFWHGLREIAGRENIGLSTLVGKIDRERNSCNLSSAIRVHVFNYFRAQLDSRKTTRSPSRLTFHWRQPAERSTAPGRVEAPALEPVCSPGLRPRSAARLRPVCCPTSAFSGTFCGLARCRNASEVPRICHFAVQYVILHCTSLLNAAVGRGDAAEWSVMLKALKKYTAIPAVRYSIIAVASLLWLVGFADQLPD